LKDALATWSFADVLRFSSGPPENIRAENDIDISSRGLVETKDAKPISPILNVSSRGKRYRKWKAFIAAKHRAALKRHRKRKKAALKRLRKRQKAALKRLRRNQKAARRAAVRRARRRSETRSAFKRMIQKIRRRSRKKAARARKRLIRRARRRRRLFLMRNKKNNRLIGRIRWKGYIEWMKAQRERRARWLNAFRLRKFRRSCVASVYLFVSQEVSQLEDKEHRCDTKEKLHDLRERITHYCKRLRCDKTHSECLNDFKQKQRQTVKRYCEHSASWTVKFASGIWIQKYCRLTMHSLFHSSMLSMPQSNECHTRNKQRNLSFELQKRCGDLECETENLAECLRAFSINRLGYIKSYCTGSNAGQTLDMESTVPISTAERINSCYVRMSDMFNNVECGTKRDLFHLKHTYTLECIREPCGEQGFNICIDSYLRKKKDYMELYCRSKNAQLRAQGLPSNKETLAIQQIPHSPNPVAPILSSPTPVVPQSENSGNAAPERFESVTETKTFAISAEALSDSK